MYFIFNKSLFLFSLFSRYIHICYPGYYDRLFNTCYISSYCFFTWVVGMAVSLPGLIGWTRNIYDHKLLECFWNRKHSLSFTIFFSTCIVALPILVISYSFLRIYLHVRASRLRVRRQKDILLSPTSEKQTKTIPSRRNKSVHLALMLFISFSVFAVCWAPYAILVVVDFADTLPMPLYLYILMLAHLHSSANWLVYAATNQHFRCGYRLAFSLITCGLISKQVSRTFPPTESIVTRNAEVQIYTHEGVNLKIKSSKPKCNTKENGVMQNQTL